MSRTEKICLFCRRDCSDRERVVDERGRYACRVCLDTAKRIRAESLDSQASKTGPLPSRETDAETGAQTDAAHGSSIHDNPSEKTSPALLDSGILEFTETPREDTEATESNAGADGTGSFSLPSTDICPTCGADVMPFNVLCLECGTDLTTGERIKAASAEDEESGGDDEEETDESEDKEEAGDASIDIEAVLAPRAPLNISAWPFTGLIAGLLAAGVWVFITSSTGEPFDVLAWGVGLAAGLGVYVWNDQRGVASTGLYAAVIALACIAGGKIGGVAITAHQLREYNAHYDDDHKAMARLADEIVEEWELGQGLVLDWPSWMNAKRAAQDFKHWPFGYPASVEQEATARWGNLSRSERERRHEQTIVESTTLRVLTADLTPGLALWTGLALITAYQFGAGGFQLLVSACRSVLGDLQD